MAPRTEGHLAEGVRHAGPARACRALSAGAPSTPAVTSLADLPGHERTGSRGHGFRRGQRPRGRGPGGRLPSVSGHDATEHVTAGASPRGSMGTAGPSHTGRCQRPQVGQRSPWCHLVWAQFHSPSPDWLLPSVSELWPLLQGQGQQMLDTAKPAGSAPAPAQRC